jgi:plastocyanin domain-containing protein
MTFDKIIVTVLGFALAAFIYWFFLMKKEKSVVVTDDVDIIVEGGYSPNVISIQKGKLMKLNFVRKDPSSCLDEVVLPDFKKKAFLPLNKTTTIEITPQETGEFVYSCGMNMFHGKIIVRD